MRASSAVKNSRDVTAVRIGPNPMNDILTERLIREINRLSEQQADAMRGAAFVEMNEKEERAYEERRIRLRELVRELEALSSRRAA